MLGGLRLVPRDGRFYDMFNRSAENTLGGARLLVALLEDCDDVERRARRLKDIEHTGDEITHEVFGTLNRTFVTPLDRDDIGRLASALDDVIDWIEETARRIHLYHISESTELSRRFARVILEQVEQIAKAIPVLESKQYLVEIERATREIHRLENEGDDLLAEALSSLYDGVTEVPRLIEAMHWGDIYQLLEATTDKAEEVAIVLRNIGVKNA